MQLYKLMKLIRFILKLMEMEATAKQIIYLQHVAIRGLLEHDVEL